jgi:hypothetical protein
MGALLFTDGEITKGMYRYACCSGFYGMRDIFVLFVACGTFLKVMVARESFLQAVVACESFLKISVASQTFADDLILRYNYPLQIITPAPFRQMMSEATINCYKSNVSLKVIQVKDPAMGVSLPSPCQEPCL